MQEKKRKRSFPELQQNEDRESSAGARDKRGKNERKKRRGLSPGKKKKESAMRRERSCRVEVFSTWAALKKSG